MNDVSRSFRGNSNAARDIAHHLHPYTNFKKHEQTGPLTIVRGRGVYVMDDDGKEYIEGMAGLWSAALGFSNEATGLTAIGILLLAAGAILLTLKIIRRNQGRQL